jgi:hypothetical protein|nr:MAG TPA: hypothetical protein [Caudoviricetes sp.]
MFYKSAQKYSVLQNKKQPKILMKNRAKYLIIKFEIGGKILKIGPKILKKSLKILKKSHKILIKRGKILFFDIALFCSCCKPLSNNS